MHKRWYVGLISIAVALNAFLFGRLLRRRSRSHAVPPLVVSPKVAQSQVTQSKVAQPKPDSAKQALSPEPPASSPSVSLPVTTATPKQPGWPALDNVLFFLAALVFLVTHLIGLDRWPIYFFSDEAINPVLALKFLSDGLRYGTGELFPTYFPNGSYLSLSVSVYAQVLPTAVLGFSVTVTRAVSALIAFSGTLAVGLILKDVFKRRFWWLGTLLLSITPAWFLHSRTAFEHVMWVGFYAWFLYFYMRYREDKPRHLLTALVFGGLSFYSYSGAQLGLGITAILLLLSDAGYHWRTLRAHPKLLGAAIVVAALIALPYLRFTAQHADETVKHLRILNSYWIQPLPLGEKIDRLVQTYLFGLNPGYWYAPENGLDLIRHQMKGYGLLLPITLPFTVLGLFICLKNFRSSPYRAVLIALLIAPLGGVLVAPLVLRMLIMVIPAALLTALGIIAILTWLTKHINYQPLAIGGFALTGAFNLFMLYDALTYGPTWYTDYGLSGLQYGGQQVFSAVREELAHSPETRVMVSPTWANATNILYWFFMPNERRVQMGSLDGYQFQQQELTDETLLVMTPAEYERAQQDPKFTDIRVERTLPYPDGRNGFYFVRLAYSPQAEAIFAQEDADRHQPAQEDITLDGQVVSVRHSQLDRGRIVDIFDNDPFTLIRTLVDNPAIIEITFTEPRSLTGLSLTTSTMDFNLTAKLYPADDTVPLILSRDFIKQGSDPTVELVFDPAPRNPIKTLRLEIKDLKPAQNEHIHVRDLQLR